MSEITFRQLLQGSVAVSTFFFFSCSDDDQDPIIPELPTPDVPSYVEEKADTLIFDHVNAVYYGDEAEAGSDFWEFSFYTDMEIDPYSNPIGPGDILRLSCNTTSVENQTANLAVLDGRYRWQSNTSDFTPFTFIWGYQQRLDLPTGAIYQNSGTFYAHLMADSIHFEPDLLTEGYFNISHTTDSTIHVDGVLIGKMCQKRYVRYDGFVKLYDRATTQTPNSTLREDLEYSHFMQARIEDQGDNFYLGDSSYRTFIVMLADEEVNLQSLIPAGTGHVMQLSFFVPWDADVTQGVPAGTYSMPQLTESNSLYREDVVPFHLNPGYPNKFTYPTGTWYFGYDNDVMTRYACINGGTMTVTHSGSEQTISFDFLDLADVQHHVKGQYVTTTPISVFNRY